MRTITRTIFITALLFAGAFAVRNAGASQPGMHGHRSLLTARITLPDGTVRRATLEGLGCTSAICSRVEIKGKAQGHPVKFWLDSIAAIKPADQDDALVVMRDGTEQRMTLVTDFRVLYVGNQSNGPEKLDLARIQSLELLPAGK